MGRKPLEEPKVQITVRIEESLKAELDKHKINKTKLFKDAALKILSKKR